MLKVTKEKLKEATYLASTINLIAVLSSPSIFISIKAGVHTKFFPDGAANPLAALVIGHFHYFYT